MNKKAVGTLMMLFEVLAVLAVAYITITVGQVYGSSDTVFKINTAEEIRMMIDTLAGIPGDAKVKFPHNVSGYIFILEPGAINIFKDGEKQSSGKWVARKFFLPQDYSAEGVLENNDNLCLEKERLQKQVKIRLIPC